MPFARRAAALSLACLACWAGPLHAKDETTPLAVGAAFDPTAVATAGFTVADTRALKGLRRVAVPVFMVEFVTADNVSAQTSGFASVGRASSALYYKLLGVGQPEFQAITDALYRQFLADLQASGLEVLGPPAFQGSPTYAKLVASGVPGSTASSSAVQASPQGLGVYGFARMGNGSSSQSQSVFSALSSIGTGFSAVGAVGDTIELAKELDASLIEVRLRVNFAQLSNDSSGFLGRLSNTAATSGKAQPSIDNLMVGVQTGPWRSTLTFKHSLTLDAAAFAEVREKAASTGEIVGAVAVELLKLAVGSRDTRSSSEMEVVADAQKYPAVIGQGLASATSIVVARLKSER